MNRDIFRQLAVIITTVYALIMNGAANAIPLNGRNTGQISDEFKVLFVPAGYVFAIWGMIYIALLAYTIYHSLPSQRGNPRLRSSGWYAALSSIANGTWIIFWHYGYYVLSLATMLVLLFALLVIYLRLDIGRTRFNAVEKWAVSIPFSIYLGWITVATIANLTDVLSYLGWNGGGISPTAWTVILLAAGALIAGVMAFTRSDIAYLLVLVWAFAGISVRWLNLPVLNTAGFITAGIVLVLLVASRLRRSRSASAGSPN
jgi:benzodiazapine receptor